ncbi:uncharacterized protein M421DRAFT_227754 [Didymella exigua CBS 183.55]|uniref:Uncharacterized protein n=1 Tax=Didymella exigua CBS 183.55 TaxID=1150837 RepID=A0A6A5RES7_9PLEO|nr:uncharacterized protein M421DRAFT_227754 [Didymella exigua CBS 183.55]KAF1925939.1 hypothetical protein M421DRAFT_227754 [Didymella exigua CBS 183.55]
MSSSKPPNPDEFEARQLISPGLENFPKDLPDRPGEKKLYLRTFIRNNKFRIIVCTIAFLTMIGGTVAAALYISAGMQRVNEGQAAISALASSPTTTAAPTLLQSTLTQTMMATQTSVVTGQITIPVSQLQPTINALATVQPAPAITCQAVDTAVTCGSLASQPEQRQ